jgi:hypothetical protein
MRCRRPYLPLPEGEGPPRPDGEPVGLVTGNVTATLTLVNRGRMEMTKVLTGSGGKPWTTVDKQC